MIISSNGIMVNDKVQKNSPPYVSYRTFLNFIDELQQRMPSRIDRSYWGDRLSGSAGTQLMATFRFLGLVDNAGVPTNRLKQLVISNTGQRTELLKEVTYEAFDFLFHGSVDLQTATYAQMQEIFQNKYQLANDVNRKCIKFFMALANDAEIPLSPFIARRLRATHSSSGHRTSVKRTNAKLSRGIQIPQDNIEIPNQMPWDGILLTKFPTFDPAWSDEVKIKWFEAFDELLKRNYK